MDAAKFNDVFMVVGVLASVALIWLGGRWIYLRINKINPFAEDLAALQRMMANR